MWIFAIENVGKFNVYSIFRFYDYHQIFQTWNNIINKNLKIQKLSTEKIENPQKGSEQHTSIVLRIKKADWKRQSIHAFLIIARFVSSIYYWLVI